VAAFRILTLDWRKVAGVTDDSGPKTEDRPEPYTADMAGKVFISYASRDVGVAEELCAALETASLPCWIAPRDVLAGESYAAAIVQAINSCRMLVLVLSKNAIESPHVLREVERASSKRRPVLSVRMDATGLPPELEYFVSANHWLDASSGPIERILPALIECVRGRDASKTGRETLATAGAARPVADLVPSSAPRTPSSRWRKPALVAALAVMTVGLAYVLADKFWLSKRVDEQKSLVEATPAISNKSVAVLPFVDLSEKKDQEYFSDGLSEELLNLLTKIPQLQVAARTSSFYYKGKAVKLAEMARELHVAHFLEGSVRKSGNRVRITAQLIRAADGYHLWSQTYNRVLDDIFKVQDEIAAAVVEALKLKLLPDHKVLSAGNRTTNPAAHTQYLLGRQFFNRTNTDDFRRAVAAYEQAIALDSNYASAYAGLAVAENELSHDPENSLAEVLAGQKRALVAADRAIAIDPALSEGYAARGFLRFTINWDWAGAEADLTRAFALDPGSYRTYTCYACFLASLGRLSEALEINKKAIELDPLSADTWFRRSIQLNAAGRLPEARKAAMRALEISPEHAFAWFNLGVTSLLESNPKAALAEFRKASKARREAGVAMAEHDLGHVKDSQRALDALVAGYASTNAYQVAEVYAWRGERDAAFTWLERAHAQHDGILVQLKFDPLLAKLHTDPRFVAMVKKMGLPP
jgi:TolB-like protein/Tfp pilus assembly protein PilF